MSAIHWSIVLAKIDLVSLYFRLLWYHSILKGSIDQYSKIHSPLACSRWLPWFPDPSRPYVACVKRGSGERCVRSQSLSSESALKSIPTSLPRRAKKDSNAFTQERKPCRIGLLFAHHDPYPVFIHVDIHFIINWQLSKRYPLTSVI